MLCYAAAVARTRSTRFSVYVVVCADDSLYVGLSNDVVARVAAHNDGRGARYTRSRSPVRLRWRWDCATSEDARRLEGLLKRLPRRRRQQVIAGDASVLGPLLIEVAERRRAPLGHRWSSSLPTTTTQKT